MMWNHKSVFKFSQKNAPLVDMWYSWQSTVNFRSPGPLIASYNAITEIKVASRSADTEASLENNISNAQSMDVPVFIVANCSASESQQERIAWLRRARESFCIPWGSQCQGFKCRTSWIHERLVEPLCCCDAWLGHFLRHPVFYFS